MAPPCRPVRMMRVDPSEPQPCAERPAPRRAPMYVERAQRLTAAPLVPCPTLTLAPLVAMLDQADGGDASRLTRLGALPPPAPPRVGPPPPLPPAPRRGFPRHPRGPTRAPP